MLQLIEIDAFVLPEEIVLGDEHRALQIRRDAAVAHPSLQAPRRLPFGARLACAELDERRRRRIGRAKRPDVGQREIDVRQESEAYGQRAEQPSAD